MLLASQKLRKLLALASAADEEIAEARIVAKVLHGTLDGVDIVREAEIAGVQQHQFVRVPGPRDRRDVVAAGPVLGDVDLRGGDARG